MAIYSKKHKTPIKHHHMFVVSAADRYLRNFMISWAAAMLSVIVVVLFN